MASLHNNILKLFLFLILVCSPKTHLQAAATEAVGDSLNKIKFKYELGLCAVFQNEDRFLKEWIEFHLQVGVQHFYLFNNLSTDNYREVLDPYIKKGTVELIDWPHVTTHVVGWNEVQCNAYKKGISLAKGKCHWLAILDTDEFLVPVSETNLVKLLKHYNKFGGLCVNWQMYGTSNIAKVGNGQLLLELLLLKAPKDYGENIHVKSIVQPMRVADCNNPHMVIYKNGYYSVNANKQACPGPFNEPILIDKVRINHYWARDEEFLFNFKIPRNVKWGGNIDNILERVNSMNQIYDPIMLQYTDSLHRSMQLSK